MTDFSKPFPSAIILFDGVCNLCNGATAFIIRHDKKKYFQFASLQGATAQQLLKNSHQQKTSLSTIVLFEKGKLFTKSDAVLKIALKLNALYPLLYVFIFIPRPLRNWVYDIIARNRYKWFGKKDSCMVPEAALKARFLE